MAAPLLPLQPLIDALGLRPTWREGQRVEIACQLADAVGRPRENIYAALRAGGIGLCAADRWAVAAGLHPAEVWGEAFYEAVPA